ncbi:MAG: metal-dependent phosphohydrolase, partial [Chloroflexi bacterium]|nr:metal-dependent phosphohydrolase [Chloroflexota bacterium]
VLFLNLADHLATRGPNLNLPHWREHTRIISFVISQHFEQQGTAPPPRLIDGHDLINIFGMKPGPKIGEILEAVHEAQASGELTSRQDALTFVAELIKSPPPAGDKDGGR